MPKEEQGSTAADQEAIIKAFQEQNEALKSRVEDAETALEKLSGERKPTSEELTEARAKKEAAKRAAMDKRDKEAEDLVEIQKKNAAGDVIRQRVCAKVDLAEYKRRGFEPVAAK